MSLDPVKTAPSKTDVTETVFLRRATAADAPGLALTGGATFLEAFTWMLPGADIVAHAARHHTAAAYERYLADPHTRITVAITGSPLDFEDQPGSIVGYAMLCTPELPTFDVLPTDIELKRIYLFSRFRTAPVFTVSQTNGSNLDTGEHSTSSTPVLHLRPAQALLDAAVADARTLHRSRLLLGTHAGNLRAIAFYRRNGFSEAGTRTFQVGNQVCSDLIFAKSL